MAIPYPEWLPLAQKPNKNMALDTPFRADQAAVGPAVYEKFTDDVKATWNLTWLFTREQERAFQLWLRSPNYLNNGVQWFTMPINLGGSGLQLQELHFTQPPTQTSDNNGVITWTGTVVARQIKNSDDDFDDIIIEFPPVWWSYLDIAMNREMPIHPYAVPVDIFATDRSKA